MENANRTNAPEETGKGCTRAVGASYRRVLVTLLLAPLALLAAAGPAQARESTGREEVRAEGEPGTAEIGYTAGEIEMVGLINDYREQKGVEPLLVSETASLAAKRHSEDMARYGFMDHETQQSAYFEPGASFDERMDASGYGHETARSENIAAGAGVDETFEGWRESPGHERNMLDPEMKVIGVGLAEADSQAGSAERSYDTYWTTDFGGHVDGTATEPSEIAVEEDATEPDSEQQQGEPGSEETAAGEQYGPGSGAGEDGDANTGNEEGTEPASGGDGGSGDRTGSGEEETATGDQYSAGKQDSSTEGSSSEDPSSEGSSSEDGGNSGEETTGENDTGGGAGEGVVEGAGERSGDRDCDTLEGFDLGPFDAGFGSELAWRIQEKVDCQLANAGNGGEEGQQGREGEGGESGESNPTVTREQTSSQQVDTGQSIGGAAEYGNEEASGEEAPDSGQGESGQGESGVGPLAGMFGGSGDGGGEEGTEEGPEADASPDSEGSAGSSGEDGDDGSTSESDSGEEGGAPVLGPASTGGLFPDNGRED